MLAPCLCSPQRSRPRYPVTNPVTVLPVIPPPICRNQPSRMIVLAQPQKLTLAAAVTDCKKICTRLLLYSPARMLLLPTDSELGSCAW
jgi:hypothetical protein